MAIHHEHMVQLTERVTIERHTFLAYAFSLAGILTLSVFVPMYFFVYKNIFMGYMELAIAVVMALNLLYMYVTKDSSIARHVLTGLVLVIVIVLFYTGGVQGTGILWMPIFPLALFPLLGVRHGLIWTIVFLLSIITLLILHAVGSIEIQYTSETLRYRFVTTVVFFIISFIAEWTSHRRVEV